MKFDNFLKLLCITLLFLYACTSNQLTNTADSCIIFDEKKSWYKATKNSYDKWNTPIAFQLAVIKQESSFTQFAKPKRNCCDEVNETRPNRNVHELAPVHMFDAYTNVFLIIIIIAYFGVICKCSSSWSARHRNNGSRPVAPSYPPPRIRNQERRQNSSWQSTMVVCGYNLGTQIVTPIAINCTQIAPPLHSNCTLSAI